MVKMSAIGDGMPRWRARFDPKRSIAEDREGRWPSTTICLQLWFDFQDEPF